MTSQRRTIAAAIATIAASVSLYPIFLGTAWFFAGVAAVLVVAAAGTATRVRRLPWPVAAAGVAVALLLFLNLAFSNSKSYWHLLPTPGSIAALGHLVSQGFTESSKYAPPVPELRGMLLLSTAGIGIAALLTDLIAVRLQSAALAGLPLLLLFTEPFTLSVSRGFIGTTIAFVAGIAGYLGLLSSEARDRIREWEQPDPDARSAPDTRALAAAGRRIGTASMVVALSLPLFIPGLHVTRLFGGQPGIGGKGGGSGTAVATGFPDPNIQLSNELKSTKASVVLTYKTASPDPDYLQLYVADQLTDQGWNLFSEPESLLPVSPTMPAAPGLKDDIGTSKVTTSITIAPGVPQDDLEALPVPYPATSVTAPGSLRADQATLMVLDYGVALSNLHYSVTSLTNDPPVAALEAAGAPPADIKDHYLSVPASYDSLRALAESVVTKAKATNPFTEAVALQNWLSGGTFKYTLNAPSVVNAAGLTNFLKVTKSGYCQQFAYAMAVLARLLGIPSRVAYGFTPGTYTTSGLWEVTTHDAHSWPELYFQGFGWLRFEPTPSGTDGQGTASTPQYTVPLTNPGVGPTLSTPTPAPTLSNSTNPNPALAHLIGNGFDDNGLPNYGGAGARAGGPSPWAVFGLVLAGIAVIGAVAPWCARLVLRRRRWQVRRRRAGPRSRAKARGAARGGGRRSGGARDDGAGEIDPIDTLDEIGELDREFDEGVDLAWAHAAWSELRDDLVDYGAGYVPSESPRAVAARAGNSLALADPALSALGRIAMAEERARYAPRPADGSGLRRDSTTVRRAIAASVPRRARWRARLMPASVLGPALGAAAAAGDIFGRLNPEWASGLRYGRGGKR